MTKSWNKLIRDAVKASGSLYSVAKKAGVKYAPLQRFMVSKEKGLSVTTAEKLGPVIGLELRPVRTRKAK